MEINEVWKDIIDFPNYQISNLGRVKSKERISNCCYNSKRKVKERILILGNNKKGYKTVCLFKNKKHTKTVHRLVMESFIKNINNYRCVNHIDGNKLNNDVKNLEIISSSENQLHAYKNNLRKENKNMKPIIRNDNLIFKNAYEASKYLNVSVCSIRDVLKGRTKTCKGYTFKYW